MVLLVLLVVVGVIPKLGVLVENWGVFMNGVIPPTKLELNDAYPGVYGDILGWVDPIGEANGELSKGSFFLSCSLGEIIGFNEFKSTGLPLMMVLVASIGDKGLLDLSVFVEGVEWKGEDCVPWNDKGFTLW